MARARLLPLLVLCTLAACQDHDDDKLMTALADYDYERDGARALLCECPSALDYATTPECEAGLGDLGDSERACIADAFDGHDQLAVDYFTCLVPIQRMFQECLIDFAGCGPDWFATCDAMQDAAAVDMCPTLPADVAEAYLACLPS